MISNIQSYLQQIKETNLVELVQSQSFQIVSQLIEIYDSEGLKLKKINFADDEGFTALHKACVRGIPEIVELLLINGANPNARNSGGETPAHMAARRGSPAILQLLRCHQADMQQLDNKGQSIAHNAVMNDSVLVLLWIETSTEISFKSKDSNGINPLHLSCMLGKINCIKFFLRKSSTDINEKNNQRDNCLHLVIKYRQLQCVPLILFRSSRKPSICGNMEQDWNMEKSSILSAKNSENKTPHDLFDELPQQFKAKNRIFSFLFLFIKMTTLKQMELNFFIYRFILFSFPFFSFLFGISLAIFIWPDYQTFIFPITSVFCTAFICTQSHRISQLDTRQNPIFAGAFLSGVLHDLLCFRVNIYPWMELNWELVLIPIVLLIFTVCLCRLVLVNPGELQLSEIATSDFSAFLTTEINREKLTTNRPLPLDRFCQVCEVAPNIDRVKHCKLCNICVVNMDHHCLFLMKCIARNNMRNFIFLIMSSLSLIALFLEVSFTSIVTSCGQLAGSSPLPYLYCSYTTRTWISVGVVFNGVSFLWGAAMLYNQLRTISHNSTYYYHQHHNHKERPAMRYSLAKRAYRVIYFLVYGRYYVTNEERKRMMNV